MKTKPQELTGGALRRQSILGVYVLVQLATAIKLKPQRRLAALCTANLLWGLYLFMLNYLYQFTEVLAHFSELKNKPSKDLRFLKWQCHLGNWYYISVIR
ncbi:hypothetical protein PseudUWO310_17205 [Pseudanabaena sp. UWO310]|nr:hypothetical protein PseudUWO310_17205 [Pseudanabaena sp. UWO310]